MVDRLILNILKGKVFTACVILVCLSGLETVTLTLTNQQVCENWL